ncbi:MAG: winged helix-turn-helix transcriptional regulator [Actinomycetota bacterium]
MTRSYGQYCALARSLDRIGDRWTLLIVRELLIGPRRYSDLRVALPGIASNLLAARLRQLEDDGLVRHRRIPAPTPAMLYELTPDGEALEEAVLALGRWGGRWMEQRGDDSFQPRWLVLALRALMTDRVPGGGNAAWQFEVEGEVMHALIDRDGIEIGLGPAPDPDLTIGCRAEILLGLTAGYVSVADAEAAGVATVTGNSAARKVFGRLVTATRSS